MQLVNTEYVSENHRIQDLCTQFGTPLYLYEADIIRSRIQELQTHLCKNDHTRLLYAMKANYNPHLVKEITNHGIGIDAVSPEEVHLALACGVSPKNILYTGNAMSNADMHEVHQLGVLLNIDSLSRLRAYGEAYPGSDVCVRVNPGIGDASHATNITGSEESKFGIPYADRAEIQSIAQQYHLRVVGIHQHVGSGWLSMEQPLRAIQMLFQIALEFPQLEFVNVGGGIGVPYAPSDTRMNLRLLGESIQRAFSQFCKKYPRTPELLLEPGRYIVAESGHLLTEVTSIKRIPNGHTIIGTNTGMNHLIRPAIYGSYHPIINISNSLGEKALYDVTGNVCESADFFAKQRSLPEVREGDILSIEIAGAYGMSMSSYYQLRALPAEVLIDGDTCTLIRSRDTRKRLFEYVQMPTN